MKHSKKARWIIGLSGVAFSAFILSQIEYEAADNNSTEQIKDQEVSKKEKELAALDWGNFTINETQIRQSDRKTKRS
ncbi:hypothetical protein H1Z61_09450 [Bacillus aquiflavi]|uniref:Uncharacterized protein n=1 Tax=Bacillus aquiflavi TaxID=2672567 RepID=A0A6B3VZD1_9BACI|nr:hypothetical protein [Bacillus aquiflavi]MBA4537361.1 hypothetical protein [Bacillus aquiflavi]NEY81617.1 hypothetical protein [Bacillus aquiflavi]UAC49185.1 hypothetical protein K6959_04675 [Bacillus aquiflavi]